MQLRRGLTPSGVGAKDDARGGARAARLFGRHSLEARQPVVAVALEVHAAIVAVDPASERPSSRAQRQQQSRRRRRGGLPQLRWQRHGGGGACMQRAQVRHVRRKGRGRRRMFARAIRARRGLGPATSMRASWRGQSASAPVRPVQPAMASAPGCALAGRLTMRCHFHAGGVASAGRKRRKQPKPASSKAAGSRQISRSESSAPEGLRTVPPPLEFVRSLPSVKSADDWRQGGAATQQTPYCRFGSESSCGRPEVESGLSVLLWRGRVFRRPRAGLLPPD